MLVPALLAPAPVSTYTIVDLGSLAPGGKSGAYGIDDEGTVVGWSGSLEETTHPFLWKGGVMKDLGVPEGTDSAIAYAVSGETVAVTASGKIGPVAYLSQKGAFHEAMPKPGTSAGTTHMNVAGDLALYAGPHAYFWSKDAGGVDLGTLPGDAACEAGGLNRRRQVVGTSIGKTARAFVWTKATGMKALPGLPGATSTHASGISERGLVAGYSGKEGAYRPVLWSPAGVPKALDVPPGINNAEAFTVDDDSVVLGGVQTAQGTWKPVAWSLAGKVTVLQDVLDASGAGWTLQVATCANYKGMIVGTGPHNGKVRAFLLMPK